VEQKQPQGRQISIGSLRLHLSGLQPVSLVGRHRAGGANLEGTAASANANRIRAPPPSWNPWAWARACTRNPRNSPAAKSNASPSRAPWPSRPHSSLPMNRPRRWIPSTARVVIKLLHEAAKQRNAAIVVVTHDPRLEPHADRIIHMEDGNILNDHMISAPPS